MALIRIHEKFCQIDEEDNIEVLRKLDKELSFKILGAEYSPAFKAGRWDGIQRILTGDLRFPYGLLSRVLDFFGKNNCEIRVEDCRPNKTPSSKIDILPKLKSIGKEPFPYQLDVIKVVDKNDIGIIKIATGGGKSLVSALIAAHFGKSTIIYVIGNDLLYQTQKFLSNIFDQPIGLVGDGICDIQDITVASVWTIGSALGLKDKILLDDEDSEAPLDPSKYEKILDYLKTAKVHILDECHLAACKTIQEISKKINAEHVYGLSASPIRDDNADLLIECVLGKKIVDISASYLIDQGYLVKPIIKFVNVPSYEGKLKRNYQTIYSKYIVENPVRNGLVVKGAEKLVEQGYQTLVLYSSVKHGKLLYEEISKRVPCVLLSGKDSAEVRAEAKAKLESGKVKCIIASKIFDIGVDLPSLSGLIMAGGGKSSVRALQRVGRVIRRYPGKKQAAIVDFKDNATFLKDHTIKRREIYSLEKGFEIIWPN